MGFVLAAPPEPVVISRPGHAGAIAVEQVELLEPVADQVGVGRLRFLLPRFRGGIAQHQVDQGRGVKPAGQNNDRAGGRGKPLADPPSHIGLARDRAVALHVPFRARQADMVAIGADICEEPPPVRIAQACLEQMIPDLVLVAAAEPHRKRADIVARIEGPLVGQRHRFGLLVFSRFAPEHHPVARGQVDEMGRHAPLRRLCQRHELGRVAAQGIIARRMEVGLAALGARERDDGNRRRGHLVGDQPEQGLVVLRALDQDFGGLDVGDRGNQVPGTGRAVMADRNEVDIAVRVPEIGGRGRGIAAHGRAYLSFSVRAVL